MGDIKYIVSIQRSGNHRRGCVCRSRTHVREHPAEDKHIKFYAFRGYLKGKNTLIIYDGQPVQ